jgi:hypothetical protein
MRKNVKLLGISHLSWGYQKKKAKQEAVSTLRLVQKNSFIAYIYCALVSLSVFQSVAAGANASLAQEVSARARSSSMTADTAGEQALAHSFDQKLLALGLQSHQLQGSCECWGQQTQFLCTVLLIVAVSKLSAKKRKSTDSLSSPVPAKKPTPAPPLPPPAPMSPNLGDLSGRLH